MYSKHNTLLLNQQLNPEQPIFQKQLKWKKNMSNQNATSSDNEECTDLLCVVTALF